MSNQKFGIYIKNLMAMYVDGTSDAEIESLVDAGHESTESESSDIEAEKLVEMSLELQEKFSTPDSFSASATSISQNLLLNSYSLTGALKNSALTGVALSSSGKDALALDANAKPKGSFSASTNQSASSVSLKIGTRKKPKRRGKK